MGQVHPNAFEEFEQFLKFIRETDSVETLRTVTEKQLKRLGFDYFGYLLLWPSVGQHTNVFVSNKPKSWTLRYQEKRYISEDLVVRHSATANLPFLWSDISLMKGYGEVQKTIFNEAAEFSLWSGATIPLHGAQGTKALFSVSSQMTQEEFAKIFFVERHALQIIGAYIHEKLMTLGVQHEIPPTVRLTPREQDILLWTARGKSAGDVADILNISENTVNEHLSNVCRKFKVSGKMTAACKAVAHALIMP